MSGAKKIAKVATGGLIGGPMAAGAIAGQDVLGGLFKAPSTETQRQTLPGLFGTDPARGAKLGTTLEALLTGPQEGTPFAPSATQQQVLESLADFAQGQTAVRGLGPATEGAIAQAVAPTFAQFATGEQQRALGRRGQDIGGLLELAGLAMPQTVLQQQQKPGGFGRELLKSAIPAGIAALCWVADSLYGKGSLKAAQARLYANSHDTMFLRVYAKYGEGWAKWLDSHSWAKPIVRPIWDLMAYKGRKMMEESHG